MIFVISAKQYHEEMTKLHSNQERAARICSHNELKPPHFHYNTDDEMTKKEQHSFMSMDIFT